MIPVKNIPSKVPAPPIAAMGTPMCFISLIRNKSAPINTPSVPQIYASGALCEGAMVRATIAAVNGATNIGMPIPNPLIGRLK